MKIAICDDEAAVSDVTKSLLQQWAIHQSISLSVHCYENGDALTLMRSSPSISAKAGFSQSALVYYE